LPSAPPADAQRLLLKGKALQDGKLLKEYNIKDGDTLNIVIKPGLNWNPTAGAAAAVAATPTMSGNPSPSSLSPLSSSNTPPPQPQGFGSGTLNPQARPSTSSKGKHTRIPSVVLSPSPSSDSLRGGTVVEKDILITLDSDPLPSPQSETLTTFHETVSKPDFWQRLYDFLKYSVDC